MRSSPFSLHPVKNAWKTGVPFKVAIFLAILNVWSTDRVRKGSADSHLNRTANMLHTSSIDETNQASSNHTCPQKTEGAADPAAPYRENIGLHKRNKSEIGDRQEYREAMWLY
jgi:hypothetical protein